jgi:diaminopimelate decarboxylase
MTKTQLYEGYKKLKENGVKRFGFHYMIVSNELNYKNLIDLFDYMTDILLDISNKLDINFEFIGI